MLYHIVSDNLMKLGMFIHLYIVHIPKKFYFARANHCGAMALVIWLYRAKKGQKSGFWYPKCRVPDQNFFFQIFFVRHKVLQLYSRFQFDILNGVEHGQKSINLPYF